MQIAQLTGQVETHLCPLTGQTLIHREVLAPFVALQAAAKKAGFDLQIASGFRNFTRQQMIWNNKYAGKVALRDKNEQIIAADTLSEFEKLQTILHWSALPGASRHHWGTDFDIYDVSRLPANQALQLTCDEYQQGGYFFELSEWLSEHMADFGFYRPYQQYRGGVAIEPWHISYHPIASQCLTALTFDAIHDLVLQNNILGKSLICQHLPMIYEQYIINVSEYGS